MTQRFSRQRKETIPALGNRPTRQRRGAGFTGGHHHRNWAIDGYRTLVMNTIAWAAGSKFPGRRPTYKVTEDELNEQLDDYGTKTNRVKLPTEAGVTFTPTLMTPRNTPLRANPKEK